MSTGTKQDKPTQTVQIEKSILDQIMDATREARDQMSVAELKIVAKEAAESRMFGMTEAQAFMLMQLAQAEGIPPVKALQRYHIDNRGRPIIKAEAVLADFQKRGGTVKWITESTDRTRCQAVFSHPRLCPDGQVVEFTMKDAEAAGLPQKRNSDGSPNNWLKWSPAMLRARVTTIGVRMVDPAILAGMITAEESEDIPDEPRPDDHLASANNNNTGHGSGAYAAPSEVEAYTKWIADLTQEINSKWLDKWTNKQGEIDHRVKDLLNTYQLSGHMLKWAKSQGMVNAPEESRAGSRDKYAAVAWSRFPDQFDNEAKAYARLKWSEEAAKIKAMAPVGEVPADECEVDDRLEGVTDAAGDSDAWPAGKE